MTLGLRIADLRLKKRKSLQQVADAVGVSKAHIWELEKGRTENPSMALVTRLADYFGVINPHYFDIGDIGKIKFFLSLHH